MNDLTHIDKNGNAIMVDISDKTPTLRIAQASGIILMNQDCFAKINAGNIKKGDVLATARIAGIMGAKRTSDLIPLCHIINISSVTIDFEMIETDGDRCGIKAICTAKCEGKTGVEMEALTGVNIALLTVYDMCKAVDKSMEITQIYLLSKHGGKSGDYHRQ